MEGCHGARQVAWSVGVVPSDFGLIRSVDLPVEKEAARSTDPSCLARPVTDLVLAIEGTFPRDAAL